MNTPHKAQAEKLQELVEVIVRMVPEIREVYDRCMQCGYGYEFCKKTTRCRNPDYHDRPITLEDVLRALRVSQKMNIAIGVSGYFENCYKRAEVTDIQWLLGSPLSLQSPETLDFLHSLLVI